MVTYIMLHNASITRRNMQSHPHNKTLLF